MLCDTVWLQLVVHGVPSFDVVFLIEYLKFFTDVLAALTIFECANLLFSLIFSASFKLLGGDGWCFFGLEQKNSLLIR